MAFDFKDKFKDECFIEIAKHYYDRNFGTFSKSEIDLVMFKILYRKMQEENSGKNPSDFELARILGITNQRVRNFKERMELKYPRKSKLEWEKCVRDMFKKGSIQFHGTKDNPEFIFFIDDINLRYDIESYLESCNQATEYTLNSKVLVLKRGAILKLADRCFEEKDKIRLDKAIEQADKDNRLSLKGQLSSRTMWEKYSTKVMPFVVDVLIEILIGKLL